MKYLLLSLLFLSFCLQKVEGLVGTPCVSTANCDNREQCSPTTTVCECAIAQREILDGTCGGAGMCSSGASACSPDATCDGMYCQCKENEGFRGDGVTCESISACNRTSPCHADADCQDGETRTEFNCTCKETFVGNGTHCEPPPPPPPPLPVVSNEDAVEIVCSDTDMSITILNSVYNNITFALQNTSCIFTNNGTHNTITIDYDTCGTTLTEDNDHLIYSNRAETSKESGAIITRDPDHYIDLVCKLERSVNVTSDQLNVTNFDSINITKDETTTFSLNLNLFPTNAFNTPYFSNQFPLQINVRDPVYVELFLDTRNLDVKLIPQNCYATPTSSPSDVTKHYIVQNRCKADATFNRLYSSANEFQFTFKAFQFLTTNDVYLHCELVICDNTSDAAECRFGCGSRKRREVEERQITEDELEKYMLTSKQIILIQEKQDESTKESLSTSNTIMFASLIIGLLIILASIFAIVMVYRLRVANGRNNNAEIDMKVVA